MRIQTFVLALMFCGSATARATIEADSSDAPMRLEIVLFIAGLVGALACDIHKDLVFHHFDVSEMFARWFWRVGWSLMAFGLIANWFGWYVDPNDAGLKTLALWGILRALQGTYISGVAAGRAKLPNQLHGPQD